MAGWNDLPTAVKAKVVEMVDEKERVRIVRFRSGSGELQALLALSTMDRELHALVSPLLWNERV